MGFDGIASQAIMFIAVLGASTLLVSMFTQQLQGTTNAINTKQDSLNAQLLTAMAIESATLNTSNGILTAYAKNTGTTKLQLTTLSIYVNNYYLNSTQKNVTIASNVNSTTPTVWDSKEVIKIVVNTSYISGTNVLKIASSGSVIAEKEFS
jgi:archaellum component FlaF (FlaF/FlaG flagellin family)